MTRYLKKELFSFRKLTEQKASSVRVLLVEDDNMIGEAVSIALKDACYAVDWVKDGVTASRVLEGDEYQAVLLDLGLPKRGGLEVLRRLRARGHTVPVIIITARDCVDDRIKGLDFGADDYLVKPFDVNELLARLRAVVRRQGGQPAPLLTNGVVSLDPATREARRGDAIHPLSAREFALLQALLLRAGTILTRVELEERIYGWNEEVESNAVDFLIHGVRKKLGADVIKNVRGAGWMVARPNERDRSP
jgi:two-component system, OmpR family, response regulator